MKLPPYIYNLIEKRYPHLADAIAREWDSYMQISFSNSSEEELNSAIDRMAGYVLEQHPF